VYRYHKAFFCQARRQMEKVYATKIEELISCIPGELSFFQLISDICNGFYNPAPLHRVCTLMRKMKARSVLRETLHPNQELGEELEMAQKRLKDDKVILRAIRLTFFCSCPKSKKWNDPVELPSSHILGYAVIVTIEDQKKFQQTFLLEAVLRPPSIVVPLPANNADVEAEVIISPITNCYVHNTRLFHTHIGPEAEAREFKFIGSFFTQQNNLTHVCAHAALRTAINSSPEFGAQKLTNKAINDILGIDFSSPETSVGSCKATAPNAKTGLTSKEIEKVAASLGGTVDVANFTEKADIEYDQYIYPVLESGYPVILGVEGWDIRESRAMAHVVAVIGHTLNSDRWNPQARGGYGSFPLEPYIPVTAWCDHFVVSDDNFGMFVTMPSDMIRNFLNPTKNPSLHASMAITILPKGVKLSGYVAEEVAVKYAKALIKFTEISPKPVWLTYLKQHQERLICRTILVKAKEYRVHLKEIARAKNTEISSDQRKKINSLSGYIWVSEISLPNIYDGNKHKLGDVITRANASEKEHAKGESVFMAWFPNFVFFNKNQTIEPWFIDDHIPFIRHSEQSILEW
jgi:hypothetical protein